MLIEFKSWTIKSGEGDIGRVVGRGGSGNDASIVHMYKILKIKVERKKNRQVS